MDHLNIDNICSGAFREIFERELREVLKNIKDPNTPPQAKRTMSFTFTFKPFVDRSGAEIELYLETQLVGLKDGADQIAVIS
jgi:hypothetical protein